MITFLFFIQQFFFNSIIWDANFKNLITLINLEQTTKLEAKKKNSLIINDSINKYKNSKKDFESLFTTRFTKWSSGPTRNKGSKGPNPTMNPHVAT